MLMAPHKVSAHFAASFPGGLCCPHAFLITLGHNSSYIWSYSFEDIILIKIPGGLCCPEQRHMLFLSIISGHESSDIVLVLMLIVIGIILQDRFLKIAQKHSMVRSICWGSVFNYLL